MTQKTPFFCIWYAYKMRLNEYLRFETRLCLNRKTIKKNIVKIKTINSSPVIAPSRSRKKATSMKKWNELIQKKQTNHSHSACFYFQFQLKCNAVNKNIFITIWCAHEYIYQWFLCIRLIVFISFSIISEPIIEKVDRVFSSTLSSKTQIGCAEDTIEKLDQSKNILFFAIKYKGLMWDFFHLVFVWFH